MKRIKKNTRRHALGQRGMALLTVVALLSFFAVVGTAFVFTMRLEEQTARNFERTTRISEIAGIGAEVAESALRGEFTDPDGIPNSGDEPSYVDSEQDSWYCGYSGWLDHQSFYTARGHLPLINPRTLGLTTFVDMNQVADLQGGVPNRFYSLGIDEDPPGDLSGDGMPGWEGVDDDGDGFTDYEDPDVIDAMIRVSRDSTFDYNPAWDDDEDGLMDEDGQDFYRGTTLPFGEGIDADDDALGVTDESGKLNLNLVGNSSLDGNHRHNQGATTFEIDPTMFFIARGIDPNVAWRLTQNLILYRNGVRSSADLNNLNAKAPGVVNFDDNGNDNKNILAIEVDEDEIESVKGNDLDDDGDYLIDEADEIFIGGEENFGEAVERDDGRWIFGDGIDNDGDGEIDEQYEGIDEPTEFNPLALRGDDNAFDTLEELRLVAGSPAFKDVIYTDDTIGDVTYYDLVKAFVTVYSSAPAISPDLRARGEDVQINMASNYTPWSDLSQPLVGQPGTLPPSLLLLQVDNDGDWTEEDDFNGNGRPDFNWDGSVNDDEIEGDDEDNDGDGRIDETDADFNQDGDDNYDPEYHLNEDPPGDANGDGLPGIGVGEPLDNLFDVLGDDDGDGQADLDDPQVANAMTVSTRTGDYGDKLDNDWNHLRYLNDRIDNDFDGYVDETREYEIVVMGIDPAKARDEGVDEELLLSSDLPTSLKDILSADVDLSPIPSNYPLEKYFPAFDDDEDGRMDEDPPEFDLLVHLLDDIDQLSLEERHVDPGKEPFQSDSITRHDSLRFNPREVKDALKLDQEDAILPKRENNPNFFLPGGEPDSEYGEDPTDLGAGPVAQVYEGSEGIFINEVMVRPVVVLQAEHAKVTLETPGTLDLWPEITDPNPGSTDNQFTITGPDPDDASLDYGDGTFYYVFNDPNDYPHPVTGFPQRALVSEEKALWEFGPNNNMQIPAGKYDVYVYQNDTTHSSKDRITSATVQIFFNGASVATEKEITWNEEGKPDDLTSTDNYFELQNSFNNTITRVAVQITVPAYADGEFSFDRVELVNKYLPYIELVNLSPRYVNLQEYSLSVRGEEDTSIKIEDLGSYKEGELGKYWINPYNPDPDEDPRNLMLIYTSDSTMDLAYPEFNNLPSDIPYLQLPPNDKNILILDDPTSANLYHELIRTPNEEGLEPDDPQDVGVTRILDLVNPSGEVVDSFEIDYKVPIDRTTGFLVQQRDDPSRAKYQYSDAVGMEKNAEPRRLYLWDADLMLSGGSSGENNAVINRMEDFWESNPRYPGQLAFKYYDSNTDTPEDIYFVWFAFNLSRRFPNLPYSESGDHYYLDVVINSAPWAEDDRIGEINFDPTDTDNIPWGDSDTKIEDATTVFSLSSGDLYSTIRVVKPDFTQDNIIPFTMNDDTYLVVKLKRPADYEKLRLLSVDLLDHGEFGMDPTESNQVLALGGGSPGVPSFAPRDDYALIHDGRFASPGNLNRVATSGPEWIPGATGICELAARLWTGYEQTTRGLINVNTAPASVLAALPWLPPRFFGPDFSSSLNLQSRYDFHALIAHRLVEGRGEFKSDLGRPLNIEGEDDDLDGFVDEGPYEEINDILRVLRDPWLCKAIDQLNLNSVDSDFHWDAHEQMAAFARVSGLITTRSNVFSVISEGRIVEAQDRTESINIPDLAPDAKINVTVTHDSIIRTILRD